MKKPKKDPDTTALTEWVRAEYKRRGYGLPSEIRIVPRKTNLAYAVYKHLNAVGFQCEAMNPVPHVTDARRGKWYFFRDLAIGGAQ